MTASLSKFTLSIKDDRSFVDTPYRLVRVTAAPELTQAITFYYKIEADAALLVGQLSRTSQRAESHWLSSRENSQGFMTSSVTFTRMNTMSDLDEAKANIQRSMEALRLLISDYGEILANKSTVEKLFSSRLKKPKVVHSILDEKSASPSDF